MADRAAFAGTLYAVHRLEPGIEAGCPKMHGSQLAVQEAVIVNDSSPRRTSALYSRTCWLEEA